MNTSNKVVFNTTVLYVRMFLTVGISLYSTRIVLNVLGAEDYGIFNLIGGLIGMLAFLNTAMTLSTQRNLSFALGQKDQTGIKKIFANSIILHYVIGVMLLILFELIGMYLLEFQLKIQPSRLDSATTLFHFVAASTFISIITVPFDSLIESHENMFFVAVMGILESILRLAIAWYLVYSNYDKLLVYGLLLLLLSIIIRIIKKNNCFRKYPESHVNLQSEYNREIINELSSFAGWYILGIIAGLFRNQGIAIILNVFYGTIVNAAYGVANQVNGQLSFFSQTLMKTIRPQMIKSEGAGDRERMLKLAIIASKFSFYLFAIFSVPLYIEMPLVLKLWLNNVPQDTVIFCRLILILTLMGQLSVGIMSAVFAIGRIGVYQTVAGSIMLLTLPLGYILLRLGYPGYYILIASIIMETINTVFRIYYFSYLTSYSSIKFIKEVLISCIFTLLCTFFLSYQVHLIFSNEFFRIICVTMTSTIVFICSIYFIGSNKAEKDQIDKILYNIKLKLLLKWEKSRIEF